MADKQQLQPRQAHCGTASASSMRRWLLYFLTAYVVSLYVKPFLNKMF